MLGSYLPEYLRYGSDPFNDKIIDSGSVKNKLGLVKRHYGLDKLCDDPSQEVRDAVARTSYRKPQIADSSEKYHSFNVVL